MAFSALDSASLEKSVFALAHSAYVFSVASHGAVNTIRVTAWIVASAAGKVAYSAFLLVVNRIVAGHAGTGIVNFTVIDSLCCELRGTGLAIRSSVAIQACLAGEMALLADWNNLFELADRFQDIYLN